MLLTIALGILWLLIALLVLFTFVSFLKIPHGLVRGPEFARVQWMFVAAILAVPVWFAMDGTPRLVALVLLAATLVTNAVFVGKFTPLWPRQSLDPSAALRADTDRHLSILASNIKMSNREYHRIIDVARNRDPDILIVIETDGDWIEALRPLHENFETVHEIDLDTGYGMVLMSKLPLRGLAVREVITEGVPSIRTAVELRDGTPIRLYVVHPEPPIASHDTKGRDGEIARAGLEARDDTLPAIIAGDLNDVAWSSTTRRFQRLSGLLDPRVGRGFFSTFNVDWPPFRWPLDHLFHGPQFRLVSLERLSDVGSDHFPVIFTLALDRTETDTASSPEDAESDEEEDVEEMIAEEQASDREAIGSDWEDEEEGGKKD